NAVTILSFLMVYPMMVTLDFNSLFQKGNVRLQLTTQLINFIVLPLMAYGFGLIFFRDAIYLRLAILLIALLPTSGMTVSWTVMSKGNVKEAIRMIVIGLILGGLLAPFYINFFLGESINLPFSQIFNQIMVIVFIPMALGFLTQLVLKKRYGQKTFNQSIKPVFPLFSTLFVVILITIVMALRSEMLFNNPSMIPLILMPLILGYGIMIIGIHFIGVKLFSFEDRIALMNGTIIRALSPALAIALTAFDGVGPEVALVIGLAYIIQVQLAAFYVKRSIKAYQQA
ncbi:arsenic resistance protein, partial [Methanocalculus natronophilus]|uniref:arsenic resistance protein n=1 Tax=Methanocalculus natronophilus TaxID=1262400 RepID=UPI0031B61708